MLETTRWSGEEETTYLALDPLDASRKAARMDVPGPWWRLASDVRDYVVKAPTELAARAFVAETDPSGREILFVYRMS